MNIRDFGLKATDFGTYGQDLSRPECVWCEANGDIWVSDSRGGVARVREGAPPEILGSIHHEPNGYSRDRKGNFFVAGFGEGKLFRITPNGDTSIVLEFLDGAPLGSVNHCWVDSQDRKWVSVSTRHVPWFPAVNDPKVSGYIILIDGRGARVVADGINFANEVKLDPSERYLYVSETLACRMLRFPLLPNGDLGPREVYGPAHLGEGAMTDGFAWDQMGNLWVTTVMQNGILVIDPNRNMHTVYAEPKTAPLAHLLEGMKGGTAQPTDMAPCKGDILALPTSLAFGGKDGRTVYVGSLGNTHLVTFRAPIAGAIRG